METYYRYRVIKLNNNKFIPQILRKRVEKSFFGKKKEIREEYWRNVLSKNCSALSYNTFLSFDTLEEAKDFLKNIPTEQFSLEYSTEWIKDDN